MLMYIFSLIIPRMQLLYAVFEKSFTPAANFLCFFAYAQISLLILRNVDLVVCKT